MSDYRIEDRAMRGTISITSFVALSFALALVPAVALGSEVLTRGIWVDGNSHEYVVVSFPGEVWDVAQDDMEVLLPGFHLATVTSQEEQDFISDLLSGDGISGQFWLGGFQDPIDEPIPDEGWTWVTQESWVYTNWLDGEPNDGGSGLEQHLALLGSGWNDEGSLIARITGYIAEGGVTGLNLVVDSPLDMGDVNPGDGLCATAMAICTLRAAIEESNAYEGPDSITLPADTYVLSSTLTVFDGLSLVGEDKDTTIIDANGAKFALTTLGGGALDSVTVRGSTQAGIWAEGGLSLISSRVRDNSGYGVVCWGFVDHLYISILDSEISGNSLDGVSVANCTAEIVGSSITHNGGRGVSADEGGGAAVVTLEYSYVADNLEGGLEGSGTSSFTLRSTTVANNIAAYGAGYASDGCSTLTSVNSTFSGNRATGHGGAIYQPSNYCAIKGTSLINTTITENVADSDDDGIGDGGGIFSADDCCGGDELTTIKGTILAENEDLSGEAPDCGGPEDLISAGFNLIGDTAGCSMVGDTSSDITGVDPVLGPLADNGGLTPTHRPLDSLSLAIDAIPPGDCAVSIDQRGIARPQGLGCDIGSVEVELAVSFVSELHLVDEYAGVAEVGVLLVGTAGAEGVLVSYRTVDANSTATEGEDYMAVDDTLVWGEGESGIQTISVPIIDDDVDESDKPGNAPHEWEVFSVELYDPVNTSFRDGVTPEATVVILDDDGPPKLAFSASIYTAGESSGFATIGVVPDKAVDDPNRTFEVSYSATAGTATAGADFTAVSGTFTWGVGDMSAKEFQVPIVPDGIHEDTESVILQLGSPVYGQLGTPSEATLEIVDDDPLGEVYLVSELYLVDETAGTAEIDVQLVGSTGANGAEISYEASAGTAIDGQDFTRTTGSLSWPPGPDGGVRTFSVPILDDDVADGDKTVVLTLSGETGILLGEPSTGELLIKDNESRIFADGFESGDTSAWSSIMQ